MELNPKLIGVHLNCEGDGVMLVKFNPTTFRYTFICKCGVEICIGESSNESPA